ncbi:MAG: putative DNA-binding domain-containing protein [Alteromonadaceae bacterium]|nr:putative DNA-binding domain-containing protein [Alteromonadaceae bacterium]
MKQASLYQIQSWMKTVLTERGDLKEKLETAAARDGLLIENVIKGTENISVHLRLDIYAAGYVMRLVECLKNEFPILSTFMGEAFFENFAKAYIVTVPSNNWSLYSLGKRFAEFLKNTQPQFQDIPEQMAFIALPAQIALLERARAEVLLARGIENTVRSPTLEIGVDLSFLQGEMMLQVPPCLQLLPLDYPILELVANIEKSHDLNKPLLNIPKSGESLLAITRVDYQVTTTELAYWQFSFLSQCTEPISVEQAINATALNCSMKTSKLIAKLFLWLPIAEISGFLVLQ